MELKYHKGDKVRFQEMEEPWKILVVDETDEVHPYKISRSGIWFWARPDEISDYHKPVKLPQRKGRKKIDAVERRKNSRKKGKEGELELAAKLRDLGYNARRGVQYCGRTGAADVVGVPGLHIECKRQESLNYYAAYDQSCHDARPGEMPVVFHRKSYKGWLATLSLDDFMKLWIYRDERERPKND